MKHSRKFLDCSLRPQLSSCLTQYPSTEAYVTAKNKGLQLSKDDMLASSNSLKAKTQNMSPRATYFVI